MQLYSKHLFANKSIPIKAITLKLGHEEKNVAFQRDNHQQNVLIAFINPQTKQMRA